MVSRLQLLLTLLLCGCAAKLTTPDKAHNPAADIWEPYIASPTDHNAPATESCFFIVKGKLDQIPPEFRIPYMITQLSDKRFTHEEFTRTTGELWQQRECDLAASLITDYSPCNFDPSEICDTPLFDDFYFPESSPIEERDKAILRILDWWQSEGRERYRGRSITAGNPVSRSTQ